MVGVSRHRRGRRGPQAMAAHRLNGAPIQEHIDPLLGAPPVQATGDGGGEPTAGPGHQ